MTTDTKTLNFTRSIPLPPARLWQAMTDTRERGLWNAPEEGMVMEVDTADLRVGGDEQHYFGDKNAPDFIIKTRWYDLSEGERAVFTETLEIGGAPLCTSLVTYQLAEHGDGSTLSVTVAVSSFSGPETLDEFETGWNGGLDNLAKYAATLGKT